MQLGSPTFHASDEFSSKTLFDDVMDVVSLYYLFLLFIFVSYYLSSA